MTDARVGGLGAKVLRGTPSGTAKVGAEGVKVLRGTPSANARVGSTGVKVLRATTIWSAIPGIGITASVPAPVLTTGYASVVVADSPAAFWTLDDASGSTTFADSSGNARSGTLNAGVTMGAAGVPTIPGTAATLNGSTGHGDIPYASWMDAPTAFTGEVWAKTTSTGIVSMLDRDDLSVSRIWQFRLNAGKFEFIKISGSIVTATATGTYNDGQWHHFVVTYDGASIRQYVDGTLVGTTAAAGTLVGNSPLTLGANRALNGGAYTAYFNGSLDSAALYPSVLSATRVQAHYNAGIGSTYAVEVLNDSPWGYWKFEDASGSPVDSSGNSHSLTVVGGTPYYRAKAIASGHAYSMALSGQHMAVNYDANLTGGSVTTEVWFYPTNLVAGTPRGMFDFNAEGALLPRISDAGLGFGVMNTKINGVTKNTAANVLPANNQVYHLVAVYDASAGTTTYYVNGVQAAQLTGWTAAAFAPGGNLLQFPYNNSEGRDTQGRFAHVAVYKSALSATRVQAHYAAAGSIVTPSLSAFTNQQNTDGAVVQWLMDQSYPTSSVGSDKAAYNWQASTGHNPSADTLFPASDLEGSTLFGGVSGSYAYCPPSENFTTSTYSCLVKPTSNVGVSRKGVWDHGTGARFLAINADGSLGLKLDGTERTSAPGIIANNTAYFIVGTYNSTTGVVKCYVNGTLVINVTGATGISVSGQYFRWAWMSGDGNEMPGYVSHLTAYQVELSAAQVAKQYSLLTTSSGPVTHAVPATGVAAFAPNPAERVAENALAATYVASAGAPTQRLAQSLAVPPATTTTSSGGASLYQGYASAVLSDMPLAYYRLDETSGTNAGDSSGHGHSGSYDSGVTLGGTSLLTGDIDKSLDLPGNSAIGVTVPLASWMQPTTMSAECWVQFDTFPTSESSFVCRQDVAAMNSSAKSWALGYYGGHFLLQVFVNNSTSNITVSSSTTRTIGTIYHVVGTYDGTTARLYVNGVLVGSGNLTGTLNPGNRGIDIGQSNHSSLYRMDGRIDEVAVYDHALSAARVQAHYNAGINAAPTPTPITSVVPAANLTAFVPKPAEAVTEHALYANVAESAVPPKVRTSVSIPAAGVAASTPAPSLKQAKITLIVPAANVRLSVSLGVQDLQIPAANVAASASQNTVRRIGYVIPAARLTAKSFGARQSMPAVIVTAKAVPPTQLDHLTIRVNQTGSGSSVIASVVMTIIPEFQVTILDDVISRAPTVITVSVAGGIPMTSATFSIDGTDIWTQDLDSAGNMGATSLPVTPDVGGQKGSHTLTVSQTLNGTLLTGAADYTVLRDPHTAPTALGDDAQAVSIPEAVIEGVRHFVIQDLVSVDLGGIGSYVFPVNPSKTSSPHYELALKSRHTTSADGQFHVFQAGQMPKEWTLSGYCSTKEFADKLLAYRKLNRRLYIIDHHNRAWKCVITNLEFDHHLRENYNGETTDWGLDYTLTVTIVDQNWWTPS